MTDLLDIAPATSVAPVKLANGQRLVVRGLNANAIAAIASRFPDLVMLMGGGPDIVPRLVTHVGAAVGPIVAAGCGHLGDDKAETIADKLLVEDQIKLLNAIFGLTFPNGLSAFVDQVTAMIAPTGTPENKVRVRSKKSPLASPHLSAADLPPTMQ